MGKFNPQVIGILVFLLSGIVSTQWAKAQSDF